MHNVLKWSNTLLKSCSICCRFLKCVWPFWGIIHERVKLFLFLHEFQSQYSYQTVLLRAYKKKAYRTFRCGKALYNGVYQDSEPAVPSVSKGTSKSKILLAQIYSLKQKTNKILLVTIEKKSNFVSSRKQPRWK